VQVYQFGNVFTYSPFGTLFESNIFGSYVTATSLLLTTFLLSSNGYARRGLLAISLALTLLAVALSLTRGAWAGLLVGMFLVMIFSEQRNWLKRVSVALVAFVVLAVVVVAAIESADRLVFPQTEPNASPAVSITRLAYFGTIGDRFDTYARALNDWRAHPWIGNGANAYAQKYVTPVGERDWISNIEVMALHDTGIIGLVLLLAWGVWIMRDAIRALRTAAPGFMRVALLGLLISFAGLLIAYQTTTAFWLGFTWIHLGLIRAGTLILRREVKV
jgi:O-antigen ligase